MLSTKGFEYYFLFSKPFLFSYKTKKIITFVSNCSFLQKWTISSQSIPYGRLYVHTVQCTYTVLLKTRMVLLMVIMVLLMVIMVLLMGIMVFLVVIMVLLMVIMVLLMVIMVLLMVFKCFSSWL